MKLKDLIGRSVVTPFVKNLVKSYSLDDLFLTGREMPYDAAGRKTQSTLTAYNKSQVAYSCIRRIASDIGSVPLTFWADREATRPARNHMLEALFDEPAAGYTREQLMQLFVTFLLLRGDATLVTDNTAAPTKIYAHFDPRHWKVITKDGKTGQELVGYEYKHRTEDLVRVPSEMVFHRLISPYTRWRGQSPLEAAASQVDVSTLGPQLQSDTLKRGGERGAVFKYPGMLQDDQYDQLLQRLKARRRGAGQSPDDFLLEGGLDMVDPRFTQSDLDLLSVMPPTKEDICQAFGMSPTIIGQANESNYSTFKGYLKIYWLQTVVPMIRGMHEAFDAWSSRYGAYIRFDLSKVDALQDYLDDKKATAKIFYGMGVSLGELNRRLDLGFDLAGVVSPDVPLTNMSMVPFDQAAAGKSYEARAQSTQAPEKGLHRPADPLTRAAQPDLAIPHQRRLSKLATRTKSAVRPMVKDDHEGMELELVSAATEASMAGRALAVMASTGSGYEDALLCTRGHLTAQLTSTVKCATDCLKRVTDGQDAKGWTLQKTLNMVSPAVGDMIQEAAAEGFHGELITMGYLPKEE